MQPDREQINCKTNSTKNIRITDGTLVLAALRENHLRRDYTSPWITTKQSFRYGKFVIRAALPEGKFLRPSIFLTPTEKHNNHLKSYFKDGIIEILTNIQRQTFYYGMHYTIDEEYQLIGDQTNDSLITLTDSLFNFHTYVMEWTESEIKWLFDDKHLLSANLTEKIGNNYNPFDKPFKLVLSLGVGGKDFENQIITSTDADQWPCPLLIIDYIRVFQKEGKTSYILEQNTESSSDQICKKVKSLLRNDPKNDKNNTQLIAIISISSFLLLLAIIPLVIYLFIRLNKSRQTNPGKNENQINIELYDEVGNVDHHTYTNPYDPGPCPNEQNKNQPQNQVDYLLMTNLY